MYERTARRIWLSLAALPLALALGLLSSPVLSQETDPAEKPAAEAPAEKKPAPKKPRGRLPAYYAKVVTAAQREEIYSIQGQYQEQIDALMKQLAEIEAKRDAEVAAVLTPEQQKQVAEMVEEARQRRAALRGRRAMPRGGREAPETDSAEASGS